MSFRNCVKILIKYSISLEVGEGPQNVRSCYFASSWIPDFPPRCHAMSVSLLRELRFPTDTTISLALVTDFLGLVKLKRHGLEVVIIKCCQLSETIFHVSHKYKKGKR